VAYSTSPQGNSLLEKKEITMARNNQHKKNRLGHWLRVVVMFLSGGFIFPHAMTEDNDNTKYEVNKDTKVKNR
jgi:hypothetical protein